MKIVTVVGNRPQFMKAAVVSRACKEHEKTDQLSEILVHTGQHYDNELSGIFFEQLQIPEPAYNLDIRSDRNSGQIGRMLKPLDDIFEKEKPDCVLVYGDTNSTLAAALTAAHLDVPLVHVEAGERAFRRYRYPEEVNRILTDHCAWLCLTVTQKAKNYLIKEGFSPSRLRFVGDPMYDLFLRASERIDELSTIDLHRLKVAPSGYDLVTIHRAENTAEKAHLIEMMEVLDNSSFPSIFPIHPRTRKVLAQENWKPRHNMKIIKPVGYFDFIYLLLNCRKCISDSGGVAREAFFAGRPCICPMETSGWSEIVEAGWLLPVGHDVSRLADALEYFEPKNEAPGGMFGDGRSGEKIVNEIVAFLEERPDESIWQY